MSGFKSGVTHDQLAVSDKDTALATLQGMKESKAWEGLFDVSDEKYQAPKEHNWQTVKNGMGRRLTGLDAPVTYVLEELGGVKFKRWLEECAWCKECDGRIHKQRIAGIKL